MTYPLDIEALRAADGGRETVARIISRGMVNRQASAHGGRFYVVGLDMRALPEKYDDEDEAEAVLANLRADAILSPIAALIAQRDALLEAVRVCRKELRLVMDGSTGGVPNAICALIPEAINTADAAITLAKGGGE